MKEAFSRWMDRLPGGARRPAVLFAVVVVGILVIVNGAFFVSAYFPKSCLTCHYMEPYYEQWKTSKHANVSCIKCHSFSPVFMTVTTLKYWTKLYNPRPRANVPDAKCLVSGCHEGRIEKGKAQLGANITFDHQEHMTKLKRGEKLRCTSCHYAIVQGEHIAVDTGVCFLCHFKGISQGQALGGCPGCHGTPTKTVEHGGFLFSHTSYLKLGVQCKQCHIRIADGAGNVPEERCHTCHARRHKPPHDPQVVHKTHVTGEAIPCYNCHERVRHGEVELVKTFEVKCDSCHKRLHTYQKEMYMGTGAKGVPDTPSRMFSAQVACDGCHTKSVEVKESGVSFPGEKKFTAERQSCVACHGKHYDLMLDDWIAQSRVLVGEMQKLVAAGEAVAGRGSKRPAQAVMLVRDARENLSFLTAGRGSHNIEYAYKILKTGYDQVSAAYKLTGTPGAPPKPAVLANPSAYCAFCHAKVKPPDKVFFQEMELNFPHALHVSDVGLACTMCHSPEKHKMRIVTKSECMKCHHGSKDIDCGQCHAAQKNLYLGKAKVVGVTPQPDVMAKADTKCTDCHEFRKGAQTVLSVKAKCEECHSAKYGQMLLSWKKEIQEKEDAIAIALADAKDYLARARKSGSKVDADEAALKGAEANYLAVSNGRGTHNYALSRALLANAKATLDRILKEKRSGKK